MTQAGPRPDQAKKPCRYFQTAEGCNWGAECYFSHDPKDAPKPRPKAPCRLFSTPAGCRFGARCHYLHVGPDGKVKGNAKSTKCIPVPVVKAAPEEAPKVDAADELLVLGYLRALKDAQTKTPDSAQMTQMENEYALEGNSKIDSLDNSRIAQCCQSYYAPIIRWSDSAKWHNGDRMNVTASGNCISMKARGWASAFLTGEFSQGVHHFKFKLEHLDTRRKFYVLMGIWRTKSGSPILDSFFTDKKFNGHALNAIDGTLTNPAMPGCGGAKYADYCKDGDEVDMFCDLDAKTLTYAINGKHYGEKAQHIHVEEEGEAFKVAVTMYWETDCIRFVSHDQKAFGQ